MSNLIKSSHAQSTTRQNVFKLKREVDTGQVTTNPYILCKRALASGSPMTLETLNSILAFNNVSITQGDYDYLLSIRSIKLPSGFPIPANDSFTTGLIGSATRKGKLNAVAGAYLLETLDAVENYIGGTTQFAFRLRYYYSKKGLAESRPIAKALVRRGLHDWNVSVYVLDPRIMAKLGLVTSIEDLSLALEQLLILQVKPNLNSMLVVNGASDVPSTYEQIRSPVYIYNSTMDTLLYIFESGTKMEQLIQVTSYTMSRNIKSGTPMYGKYVFTRTPIEGAVSGLITLEALRADLEWCYINRAKLRDYSKPASNMIPVILTDLENGNQTHYFNSKRKACLFTMG
ncbi:MAG: hypothetical protein EOO61_14625, partial [Hymenobacter sp.]